MFNDEPNLNAYPDYRIYDTDYKKYLIPYKCSNIAGEICHVRNVWIQTRERNPLPYYLESLLNRVEGEIGISRKDVRMTIQDNGLICNSAPESHVTKSLK